MSAPGFRQDILSGIYITIMHSTAIIASPIPYSKVCDTFRPRRGQAAARRTDLGGKTFVHFLKPCAMLNSLVRELSTEGRPTYIKNGFRHSGLGEFDGADIPHRDIVELPDDAGREFVVKVAPRISNTSVDVRGLMFLARALRDSEFVSQFPQVPRVLDLLAVGQHGKVLQSEVDANSIVDGSCSNVGNVDCDIQKPVTTSVTREVSAILDLRAARDVAALEHLELAPVEVKAVGSFLNTTALEWHPTERFLATVAQVGAVMLAPRLGILLAHGVDRIRVQSQLLAAASCQFVQVEAGLPASAEAQRIFLPIITEIPDKVAGPALLVQQAVQRLHPVSVYQDHFCFLRKSSRARLANSDTGRPVAFDNSLSRANRGSGKYRFVRFIHHSIHNGRGCVKHDPSHSRYERWGTTEMA